VVEKPIISLKFEDHIPLFVNLQCEVDFMPVIVQTTLFLIASNVFMTIAWYAHLKDMIDAYQSPLISFPTMEK